MAMQDKPTYEELERRLKELEKLENGHKQAKDSYAFDETLFRAIAEQSGDGISLTDIDGNYIFVNPAFCQITGYTQAELLKMKVNDLVPAEIDIEIFSKVARRQSGKREVELLKKNGSRFVAEVAVYPVNLENRRLGLGIVRDISERRKIEDALRESNSFNSSLLEHSPVAILVYAPDTTILYVNPLFEKLTGYTGEEVRGLKAPYPWWVDDPEYGTVEKRKKDILEGIYRAERRFKKKSGEYSWVELNLMPIFHNGKLSYELSMWVDISERKEKEEKLAENEKFLQIAGQLAKIGYWSREENSNEITWSAETCRIFGLEPKTTTFTSDILLEHIHPEDHKKVYQAIKDALTENIPLFDVEYRILRPDGTLRWVHSKGEMYFDKNRSSRRVAGMVHDITERKRSGEALKKSEAKYRTMIEAIKDPVYISSTDDRIQYMNKAMIERVGYDAIGQKCHVVFHGFDEKCSWCDSKITFQEGHSEKSIVSPKDNRSYNVSSSRFINEDGSLFKVAVFRDMTEFEALQENLLQAQKMESIGTLAGGIAHDFNNILSPIMLHAEMIMDDLSSDDPLKQDVREIYKAGRRAKDLVQQILTFARKRPEEKIILRSSLIVKEVVKFLRSTIPTTIEIQYKIKTDQDRILADPTQINQILMNLCTNAAHAMREKGGILTIILDSENIVDEITNGVFVLKPGKYLKLSVRDNGSGISPENIQRIFEPYYTTKNIGEGTGFGLAIIHSIVHNYSGNIVIESEVGKGTIFHIYIPLIEVETQAIDEQDLEAPKGKERILIVDDEESILNVLQKMLERLGYRVTARTKAIETLKIFRDDPNAFDLVITDMTMPNMTGKELADELKKTRSDIPVILCTGFSNRIDENEAKQVGIDAFIMKPISRKAIADTIRKVLDKKQKLGISC